ncbi:TPA: DUF4238 domain-containing protein [Vibrio vulnificus]|nr:DUF4238 domain-containing protein [Vibrio vulnificus]
MTKTRDNHFVPQWHQKGFMDERDNQLCHLMRRHIDLKNGETKTVYSKKWQTSAQRFYKKDLYSTFLGTEVNDEIEQKLFGPIDDNGSIAIRAFLTDDQSQWHQNFQNLFIYLDAQKLRTPKGLDWIQSKYPELTQLQLMMEMQSLRSMHCTFWAEGVRELVSAENSDVKFIVSDHPVTIYNYACSPDSELCGYPSDPDISLKGSQTIFPLDKNRCLILTNLEYAQDPDNANPLQQRTNATRIRQSMVNTIEFINSRKLTSDEVSKINYVIKSRAQSSVAAGKEEWLYPENDLTCDWADIRHVLLPPSGELHRYGGEMFAKFEDGSVHYQDAFGRITPPNDYLNKNIDEAQIGRNSLCGCGSGRKYKNCCRNVPVDLRATWDVASIRERNLAFCNCIRNVLGLDSGKTWLDVRRELSDDQISKIYGFYSSLWPRETDIYSLLPKPDGKFRGLYTGPLDVRVIGAHALPLASAFDEFLIETPVTNPNNIRPEFSPTESPSKYKYQALKDFLFMLEIEPFIGLGLVNLIPNPSEFDLSLMRAMMGMARDRARPDEIICEQDRRLYLRLSTEDLLNSIAMMPRGAKIQLLMHQFGLTEEMATESISELELHAEASPLMMLQQMNAGEGGQFMQFRMGPNYEMALFVAQVTGSVIITDSNSRWRELVSAQHREQGIINYPWNDALSQLSSIPIDYQFLETLQKSQRHFAIARNLIQTADRMVLGDDRDVAKLTRLAGQARELVDQLGQVNDQLVTSSFKVLSPEGGFYDTNVQRLLAQSRCLRYDNRVRSIYGIGLPE